MAPASKPDKRPVFMMLTSPAHPVDVFLLSLRTLEQHTNLSRFKAVYICCNHVGPDRKLICDNFARRNPNAQILHCSPVGHHPCVPLFINSIVEEHWGHPIIKTDDDMFFTPGWLEKVMEQYAATRHEKDVAFVAPLVPINTMGIQPLIPFMMQRYGSTMGDALVRAGHIGSNEKLHDVIWDSVLNDNLIERFVSGLDDPVFEFSGPKAHISINCVCFDDRLAEKYHPLPLNEAWFLDQEKCFDESMMNRVMNEHGMKGYVVQDAIVHHYCFNRLKEFMFYNYPLDRVREFVMNARNYDACGRLREKAV
ncbi:hypothetical protein [Salidesulfovibrio onnuriiensis]|uniref:hypothetical protein n=1 Tax=Salidesulfovibrio onnuriiensis TaxID=2583823 RepID=UPI0011CB74E6|nr:hypothetical protein [Salidesulfovibrio onnuriiensis]